MNSKNALTTLALAVAVMAVLGATVATAEPAALGVRAPSDAQPGEEITVRYTLSNTGEADSGAEDDAGGTDIETETLFTLSGRELGILGVVYLLTGLLAAIITPVATVVLLTPVAIEAAISLGVNPLAFVFAVLFAASSAFMTPVGYQTNLMVYGPGGYRFTDYVRVGAPLQVLLSVVTTAALVGYFGV